MSLYRRAAMYCAIALLGSSAGYRAVAQMPTRSQALSLEQNGQVEEAERIWKQLGEANPQDAEPPAHMGLMESRQQHYEAAAVLYKHALDLDPGFPGLQMNLGLAYFKAGDFPDAMRTFRTELRKSPGDQRLTTLLGMAHFAMSDYLVAIPYFRQAVSQDPQNLALQLALAQSCLWSKQFDCVLDVQKQIRGMNAESAEVDMLAAQALDSTDDRAGAIGQLRAAIQTNPSVPDVHFALGYLLWKDRQFDKAAEEFEAELTSDPNQTQTLAYLGDSYLALNDYRKAEPALDRAAAQDTSLEMVHRDLGLLYASTGRKDKAVDQFQQAIRLDRYDPAPHTELTKLQQPPGSGDTAKLESAAASSTTGRVDESLAQKLTELQPAHP